MGQLLSSTSEPIATNTTTNTTHNELTSPLSNLDQPSPNMGLFVVSKGSVNHLGVMNENGNHTNDLITPTTGVLTNTTSNNATSGDFIDEHDFSVNIFGTVLYPFRWITLTSLATWLGPLCSLAMIIGCVLPYVPQYITIYRERSCTGFSTYVCLTLLIANILRIAFWFGHKFELPLLIQSVIMILAQILLLELCVRVKRQNAPNSSMRRNLLSMNPKFFWRWTDLASHLVFLVIFTTILGCAVYYFIDNKPFIESLGYCALVTESMLGVPQVIRNYRKRSVAGMSLSMVFMWLAGDTFKTGYFIANAVPYQFWLCGLTQVTIDIVILFQVCLFKQNAPTKMRSMCMK
uniref:Solute carrier family 66 member 2 n=1 Tax=Aceria tosichella TaxID=561515 RepID=A0A6G1SGP9_9ACAR